MAGQTIQVSVLADTKKFSRAMKQLGNDTGFSKLAAGAKKLGKAAAIATTALAAVAVVGAKKAVSAASDLQQSMGGVDAVFKDSAKQVHNWAKSAATDMGLSKNAYNTAATSIGTTLKNAGVPMKDLGKTTNNLIGLSSDLAATFGGDVQTATEAMGSALRGEFEPLRKYGISLSQAEINARALAKSGKTNEKQLTKTEKALATQELMYEQSADAQGAFARESNTLAGQQERLKAKFENIMATLGTYLLPVMTKVTEYVSKNLEPAFAALTTWIQDVAVPRLKTLADWFTKNVVPAVKGLGKTFTDTVLPVLKSFGTWITQKAVPALVGFGGWVVKNKDWLAALAVVVGTILLGIKAYTTAMALWKAATAAAAAAQVILNVALNANPIGIIILAIAGLVAGLVFFFKKTKTGQKIWKGFTAFLKVAWEKIKGFFAAGWKNVNKFMSKVWTIIKAVWKWSPLGFITSNWGRITKAFGKGVDKVKGWLKRAWDFIALCGSSAR
ncbi:hypothetical protein [Demequina litorisediminis]|uniref:Phage-related minor tail protein n=1 Tax=Demequina litorisediminis TaxID=1849022 RepID=A0ABQ6IDC7_9MICO|nr:hypothetical protein [Demequina litorisediminis]GMA34743.1 hypothetical protein GCM10025876_09470 [Demequina litorisediminis]